MTAKPHWAIGVGLAAALAAAVWLALMWLLPSDDELALQLTEQVHERLGVKASIGSVHWALLPQPVVTVHDFRTQQTPPVRIAQLTAYLDPRMLLRRRLVVQRMLIDDASVAGRSLHAWHIQPDALQPEGQAQDPVPLQRLEFRNLTWISYSGVAVVFEGEVDFDAHWRPRYAQLRRPGAATPSQPTATSTPQKAAAPFTLSARREAPAGGSPERFDRWQTRIHVGGGTAHGQLSLTTTAGGDMQLSGQLAPRGIDVASALNTFNRRSPLGGKAYGQTAVSAHGDSLGRLVQSLHTHSVLSIHPATVLHFDLDKAVHTAGKEHDGQTPLQSLTGEMDTQNTLEGLRVSGTDIRASTEKYTITGNATLYHGELQASGNLDWVEGALGVPFTLSGPAQKPTASVPPGFFAGAAIGTAVLPGVGTAIGARIGGALGKIFKGDTKAPAKAD